MTTTITVKDWRGGHANVGGRSTAPAAPMTPLAAGKGSARISRDGAWRYVRDGRAVAVQHVPSGEWMWDEKYDSMHLGFTTLADARRFTAEVDAQAAADETGFTDSASDCPCIDGRCACTTDSIDYDD